MINNVTPLSRVLCVSIFWAMAIGAATPASAQQGENQPDDDRGIENVIVTASRNADLAATLPTSWSIVGQSELQGIAPQHSNQVFNRVAGSWVSRGKKSSFST